MNQSNGKMHFGMRITNWMKELLHWVQHFYHISIDPTIVDLYEVMFIQKFETDLYSAEIRNKIIYQCNTKAN